MRLRSQITVLSLGLLMSCSAAQKAPETTGDEATFETTADAGLVEAEAGAAVAPDAGTATEPTTDGTEDAGAIVAVDAAPPDAGPPDAGSLKPEPELSTPELNERFKKALELAPDDPAAAVQAFDAISAEAPEFYFAAYNSALSLQRTGDTAGAETRLRDLHGRFGDRYHGFAEALAWLLHGRGASGEAESLLQSAIEAHPLVLSLRNSYGRLLLDLGKHTKAGDLALATLKKDEVNVGAMQVLGWSFCKRKKMDLCLLVLGNALKVPGKEKDGMTNYLAALAYLQFADRSSKLQAEASVRVANKHLAVAADAMPDRVEVLVNYARVLLDSGDPTKAEKLAGRATRLAPSEAATWLVYGLALRDNKKRDESRKAQLKALEVGPERHEALFNLGILYLDHPLKKIEGDEVCPDVTLDSVKGEVGDDLFEGIAIAREDPKLVDGIRRVRQAGAYLARYNEQAQPTGEMKDRLEGLLREVDKSVRKQAKRRMRLIKRAARAKKKEERKRKKLERERKKKEAEEKRKAEEAAKAAAEGGVSPGPEGAPTGEAGEAVPGSETPGAGQPPAGGAGDSGASPEQAPGGDPSSQPAGAEAQDKGKDKDKDDKKKPDAKKDEPASAPAAKNEEGAAGEAPAEPTAPADQENEEDEEK